MAKKTDETSGNTSGKQTERPHFLDENGKFKKGVSPNPAGKPRGRQDNLTRDMKQMLHDAMRHAGEIVKADVPGLSELDGGTAYLAFQAIKNPSVFGALIARTMPAKVDVDVSVLNGDMVEIMERRRRLVADMRRSSLDAIEDAIEVMDNAEAKDKA